MRICNGKYRRKKHRTASDDGLGPLIARKVSVSRECFIVSITISIRIILSIAYPEYEIF